MIKKVKNWLGIEGVKLEVLPDAEQELADGMLRGTLRFTSLNAHTVSAVQLVLIEKYTRGRGTERLIDEYELGRTRIEQTIEIPENGSVEIGFRLPFNYHPSRIERYGKQNFIAAGIAGLLKRVEGVQSEFRIEAEAKVPGTALNPFDKQILDW